MHLHSENMKTLALRLDSMNHASYKLFIFPRSARLTFVQFCCHHIAAGLFEIWGNEAHFHVAHLPATMRAFGRHESKDGRQSSDGSVLQTTVTHKGPSTWRLSKVLISLTKLALSKQTVTYKDASLSEPCGRLITLVYEFSDTFMLVHVFKRLSLTLCPVQSK